MRIDRIMQVCGCHEGVNYSDDLCEAHREAYENYCLETAAEDRMSPQNWFDSQFGRQTSNK